MGFGWAAGSLGKWYGLGREIRRAIWACRGRRDGVEGNGGGMRLAAFLVRPCAQAQGFAILQKTCNQGSVVAPSTLQVYRSGRQSEETCLLCLIHTLA